MIESSILNYLHSKQFNCFIEDGSKQENLIAEIQFNIKNLDKLLDAQNLYYSQQLLQFITQSLYPLFDFYIRTADYQIEFYLDLFKVASNPNSSITPIPPSSSSTIVCIFLSHVLFCFNSPFSASITFLSLPFDWRIFTIAILEKIYFGSK